MCGYIGRVKLKADPGTLRPLKSALPRLGRRGPDSCKEWVSVSGLIEFLHCRLSIVDRSSVAHQPLSNDAADVCVMFVGEVYNHRLLRAKYRDYPFRTESDTEVILAAYLKKGAEALGELRGMFTVAIADLRTRQLILARDSIGKKPLYIANWGGAIYFGSSVLAMRASFRGAIALSNSAPHEYWTHGFIPPGQSALAGCKPVEPGCILAIDIDDGTINSRLLNLETCSAPSDDREVYDQFDNLFREAVERRLDNNPSPTALLSGGIDSTVVVEEVARICKKRSLPLQVLTLGSVIPMTNDEFYARYAARKIGVPLDIIRLTSEPIQKLVFDALDHQDEPLAMLSFIPLYRLVKAAGQYSRIVIGGDGGDEIFLGYGKAEDWVGNTDIPFHGNCFGQPMPPRWMSAYGWRAVTTDLIGHGFAKMDRASAEQGVEMRAPLLDSDLVSFARQLSPEILLANNQPKALLKRRLRDWPDWFIRRPKLGLAHNTRWVWGFRNFAGLRESITQDTVEQFSRYLPHPLRRPPLTWSRRLIFAHFPAAIALLAWSSFETRLRISCG